jgi:hypothetical protein
VTESKSSSAFVVRVFETEGGGILVEDAAHLTADFMRRSFGVASGDFGL